MVKGEIITAKEALERVGLGDLATDSDARDYVEWAGYPRPFACGHTAVYGHGPLSGYGTEAESESAKLNDRKGSHRIYQSLHRVSQHFCSGPVLFAWGGVGGVDRSSPFSAAWSLCVVVVELDDQHSTALRRVLSA